MQRWSRRKRERSDIAGETGTPAEQNGCPESDPGSENKGPAVDPARADDLHRDAFRRLWAAEPALFEPDELDDYLEDFSESARAVAPGLLVTAYAIGRGFWSEPTGSHQSSEPASSAERQPASELACEPGPSPDADESGRA